MLDHLHDLEADFRVFYGLDPEGILNLSGPRFLALAWRAPAFDGALASRLASQEAQPAGRSPGVGVTTVEPSRTALRSDPVMAGLIDW